MAYSKIFGTKTPMPVSAPIPGKKMIPNSTGGYVFDATKLGQLQRFLILGAEGGTYYADAVKHGVENCQVAYDCVQAAPKQVLDMVLDVSVNGRAFKNEPAIFILAMCLSSESKEIRNLAFRAIPKVCRIPTHWFQLAQSLKSFRKWGRGLKKAFAALYVDTPPEKLAYHVTKYPSRTAVKGQKNSNWRHWDLIKLCKPNQMFGNLVTPAHKMIYGFCKDEQLPAIPEDCTDDVLKSTHDYLQAALRAKSSDITTSELVKLIEQYHFGFEHICTENLSKPDVLEALLHHMPINATVRYLGRLSSAGLTEPFSHCTRLIIDRLSNAEQIKRSRMHPVAFFLAQTVYASGNAVAGKTSWTPNRKIVDALNDAFYASFAYVEPAGKNFLLALDISGSMFNGACAGASFPPAVGAALMAMSIVRVEKACHCVGFNEELVDIPISAQDNVSDVIAKLHATTWDGGSTDASLPILEATAKEWPVDCFVVLTDSEVNTGKHPSQVLDQFRAKSGIDARAACMAMVANKRAIFDPTDPRTLMMVGMDSNAPRILSEFATNWSNDGSSIAEDV